MHDYVNRDIRLECHVDRYVVPSSFNSSITTRLSLTLWSIKFNEFECTESTENIDQMDQIAEETPKRKALRTTFDNSPLGNDNERMDELYDILFLSLSI